MATVTLPAATNETSKKYGTFTEPVTRAIEPVGRFFLGHAARTVRGHTWSEYEKIEAEKANKVDNESEENGLDLDEEQSPALLAHDPRDWKTADLYAALGLSKYRYKASTADIRTAYRKAVLKHHPDKMAEKGSGLDKDGFFKIVQKAYETLMDPIQRKRYDSVDSNADIEPPSVKTKYDFFEAFGPVFESEARFSKKPMPLLGDIDSDKKYVDEFYNSWYQFDSWRTFEFADEEVPDDSSNRDHKRYIERKNKAARDKKKTEDNKRLTKLIDRARAEDPRIKLFRQREKEEKARRKWEREAGSRKAAEEAKAKAEEEAKAKAEEEAKAKSDKESKKKSKEAAKSAKKKNKRAIKGCAKAAEYFGDADKAAAIDADLELLVGVFDDVTLADVAEKISGDAKAVLTEAAKGLISSGKLPEVSVKYFK